MQIPLSASFIDRGFQEILNINKQLVNEMEPDLPQPGIMGRCAFCRGCIKSSAILSKGYFKLCAKMLMNSYSSFIGVMIGVGFFNRRVAQLFLAIIGFLISMIYLFLGVLFEDQEWLLSEV